MTSTGSSVDCDIATCTPAAAGIDVNISSCTMEDPITSVDAVIVGDSAGIAAPASRNRPSRKQRLKQKELAEHRDALAEHSVPVPSVSGLAPPSASLVPDDGVHESASQEYISVQSLLQLPRVVPMAFPADSGKMSMVQHLREELRDAHAELDTANAEVTVANARADEAHGINESLLAELAAATEEVSVVNARAKGFMRTEESLLTERDAATEELTAVSALAATLRVDKRTHIKDAVKLTLEKDRAQRTSEYYEERMAAKANIFRLELASLELEAEQRNERIASLTEQSVLQHNLIHVLELSVQESHAESWQMTES